MFLTIRDETDALSRGTHPTVHEIVVGDRHMPVRHVVPEGRGLIARIRHRVRVQRTATTMREAITEMFHPGNADGRSASTTLATLDMTGPVATMRMVASDGSEIALTMHEDEGRSTYSIGRRGAKKWRWTTDVRFAALRTTPLP